MAPRRREYLLAARYIFYHSYEWANIEYMSKSESMRTRMKCVLKILERERADALLVWNSERSGQPATAWLSGFMGSWSILLLTPLKRFLVTDGRYATQSNTQVKGYEIFITSHTNSSLSIVRECAKRWNIKKILFDGTVTPYSVVEDARRELPETIFSSRARVLQELRVVKESGELKLLATAASIACHSFAKLLPLIQVGITERELARRLETLCLEEGASEPAFTTIVASGENGALPHARATEKRIQKGELITIDFGIRYKGYASDMTRTVAMGKVSPRLRNIYEAVRIAQELGCRKARAGMTGQELDAVCRASLIKKRYGKYFTHGTGHGIGIEVHELPLASQGEAGKSALPAGSVITCEPGIYIPGVGGVRIEDALVLTKQGNVNLTASVSKKLLLLPC